MSASTQQPQTDNGSLYDLLAVAPPVSATHGETKLTATKETVDADTESTQDDEIIFGRGD